MVSNSERMEKASTDGELEEIVDEILADKKVSTRKLQVRCCDD
jgi:hypothetical protein